MPGWEENVRDVLPYVPGEQPGRDGVIKLNTNENPYPPAPGVSRACVEMDAGRFKMYPDPDASLLRGAIAEYYGVDPSEVFTGVGSDDVLALSFLTFFNSERPVLFPDITYSFYDVWARLFHIPFERPALRSDFRLDVSDYLRPNGGIVIANPNAPTSLYEPVENIEKIVAANGGSVVIIDEAYIDFGGESALPLIRGYDNVLIVRTFSKSRSLAGVRIGFAMGNAKLINALKDVKSSFNSYTIGMPQIALGVAALKDEAYFRDTLSKIADTRERAKARLRQMGFTVLDSKANFLFASHEKIPARLIFEKLREKDIYVRYFNKPRIDGYLRITIGTDDEMEALFDALKKIEKGVDRR